MILITKSRKYADGEGYNEAVKLKRIAKAWPEKMVISTYLASRARAMIPAASGADAEVPVCESVHFDLRSVVTYGRGTG